MDIGERIKDYRNKRSWSQQELADKLNVSRQTVSRWEIGSSIPDVEMMMKISDLFEVDLQQLVSGEVIEDTLRETISNQSKMKKGLLILIPLLLIFLSSTIFFYVRSNRENNYQIETARLEQINNEIDKVSGEFDKLLKNKYVLLPDSSAQFSEFADLDSRINVLDKSINNLDTKVINENDIRNLVLKTDGLKQRIDNASKYLEVYQILMKFFNSDFLNENGESNGFLEVKEIPSPREYDKLLKEIKLLPDGSVKNEFQKVLDQLMNYNLTENSR